MREREAGNEVSEAGRSQLGQVFQAKGMRMYCT